MPPKQGSLGRPCAPSGSATCGARMSQTTLLSKAARKTGNPSSSVPPSDVSTNFNCTLGTLAQCVAQASKRPLAARMGTKIRGKDFKRSSRSPPPIQNFFIVNNSPGLPLAPATSMPTPSSGPPTLSAPAAPPRSRQLPGNDLRLELLSRRTGDPAEHIFSEQARASVPVIIIHNWSSKSSPRPLLRRSACNPPRHATCLPRRRQLTLRRRTSWPSFRPPYLWARQRRTPPPSSYLASPSHPLRPPRHASRPPPTPIGR